MHSFKPPKSKAGRREVTLPDILVDTLRDHRKAQLELSGRAAFVNLAKSYRLLLRFHGGELG
jgi:hypothetical protein